MSRLTKNIALSRLVYVQNQDILFLQESMCEGDRIVKEIEIIFKGLKFDYVDAKGNSSSLILGWKVNYFIFNNV